MEATTEVGTEFGLAYKLLSTIDPNVSITIYPSITEDFALSKELPPGNYYFNKIKKFLVGSNRSSKSSSKPQKIGRTIMVDVQAGTITIANEKLVVNAVRTGQKPLHSKLLVS